MKQRVVYLFAALLVMLSAQCVNAQNTINKGYRGLVDWVGVVMPVDGGQSEYTLRLLRILESKTLSRQCRGDHGSSALAAAIFSLAVGEFHIRAANISHLHSCKYFTRSKGANFNDAAHTMRYIMPPVFSSAARACAITSL